MREAVFLPAAPVQTRLCCRPCLASCSLEAPCPFSLLLPRPGSTEPIPLLAQGTEPSGVVVASHSALDLWSLAEAPVVTGSLHPCHTLEEDRAHPRELDPTQGRRPCPSGHLDLDQIAVRVASPALPRLAAKDRPCSPVTATPHTCLASPFCRGH